MELLDTSRICMYIGAPYTPKPSGGFAMSDQENMVLRSVFLPPELDDTLRRLAYEGNCSKGELIRAAVQTWVHDHNHQEDAA